ncbi:MAG: dihydrofolate reductase, partial [Bacteroidota bacterium]
QKELLYYLSEAAVCGRDIIYDQNYRHNLLIRHTLENIYRTYSGDKTSADWTAFHTYLKRIWFSNGIHHHYSTKKFLPDFDYAYFKELVGNSDKNGFPLQGDESINNLLAKLQPVMFDPNVDNKRVNKGKGMDLVLNSANNYYGPDVTQAEVEAFYKAKADPKDKTPVSWGLNSQLVKENGELKERVYKFGGLYGNAIAKIIFYLRKAANVAENDKQKKALSLLADYYESGDLKKFDEYNIAWVQDTESDIDVINGFIEVYGDAMGYRGAFESVVQIADPEATKRIAAISQEAQWFEDNSTIMDEHKKEEVKGISARVINVVMESGDASPSTPIGINLPNANWIRSEHGSKSVNLANIVNAYDEASKASGVLEEFAWSEEEIALTKKYGSLSDNLHTDMHEVIGHASG